jgi:hypothetical protein
MLLKKTCWKLIGQESDVTVFSITFLRAQKTSEIQAITKEVNSTSLVTSKRYIKSEL